MNQIAKSLPINAIELALIKNDLSSLNPQDRLSLYNKTCESLGLNPLTQPFGYLEFRGGKLSLYAKKDATDQLRRVHGVSIEITSKEKTDDIYIVTAKAKDKDGRIDEDMGTVSIKGLFGDALANAYLKAITKAKRRVTLSICGLGLLDETEIETIPDIKVKDVQPEPSSQQSHRVIDTRPNQIPEFDQNEPLPEFDRTVAEQSVKASVNITKVNEAAPELTKIPSGKMGGLTIKDAFTFKQKDAIALAKRIRDNIEKGEFVSEFQLAFVTHAKQLGVING